MTAPVALFVYNRPWHAQQTVEALRRNDLAAKTDLHIFSDAPKKESIAPRVAEVRHYIHLVEGFRSVTITERQLHLGLANSIIDGVTRLVNASGQVIVLEDDLVVAPGFLALMNRALDRYADEVRVMQISGFMFPVPQFADRNDALFLPFISSWGWATWARSWKCFDPKVEGSETLARDPALRCRFDVHGAFEYSNMLQLQKLGRIDSWAIRWYWSVFRRNGLTLFPPKTYVVNIGFNKSGSHGWRTAKRLADSQIFDGSEPPRLPNRIESKAEDIAAVGRVLARAKPGPLGKIARYIYRQLRVLVTADRGRAVP